MHDDVVEGSICHICGLDQAEEIKFLLGSICGCCGTEYLGTYFMGDWTRAERKEWIDAGYPWFRPSDRPIDWDPIAQLNQIPEKYR